MPEPRVSDHALLRFIERVLRIDIEALRALILTPGVAAAIRAGATGVEIDGIKFVVKGGLIVTVLAPDQKFKPDEKCVSKVSNGNLAGLLQEFRGGQS